ncbi:MAG: CheY-like chemotaxis protein, partial [Gammaproteobacteria bacterium]
KGSTFYVTAALSEQTQRSIIKQGFADTKIIIIDSRKINCLNIEEQMIASGANCHTATTIENAQDILNNKTDSEIIMIESRLVFKDEKINSIISSIDIRDKVILLVNPKDMAEHTELAKANNINRMLLKPIKRNELFREVNKIINKKDESLVDDIREGGPKEEATPKHILLVEDNPDNRMLIKAYLKKTPYSLDEAENGSIAVELFKQNNYDMVFMDVQMPVMDGHEATRLIREWEKTHDKNRTKIISLTAHAIREEIDKCMAAGCDSHLSKPIKKATLLSAIEELS